MGYWIGVGAEQSLDSGNNVSYVRAWVDLYWNNSSSWSYGASNTWGSVTIGGETFNFGGPKSGGGSGSGSTRLYTSPWKTFGHDNATGYRGAVGTSGYFTGDYVGSFSPYDLSAGGPTFGAVDYDRRPSDPTFASISRSGTSYTVTINAVSSPGTTPTYYIKRSENGNAYAYEQSSTGRTFTFTGCAIGSTQVFQIAALNGDGWNAGGWQYSGTYTVPNVPSAPSSVNITTTGTTIKVLVGASSSNGGDSGTPTYKIRYSSNGGSSWSSYASITPGVEKQYAGMTPGLTYTFQAVATNSVGDSSAATAAALLVVGGKRWDGSSWVTNTIARRWDGYAWRDLSIAKRWDGSDWVNLA